MAHRSEMPTAPEEAKPRSRRRGTKAEGLEAVPTEIPAEQAVTARMPHATDPAEDAYDEYSVTQEPERVFLPGVHERPSKPRSAPASERRTVKTVRRLPKSAPDETAQEGKATESARAADPAKPEQRVTSNGGQDEDDRLRQEWRRRHPVPLNADRHRGELEAREQASARLYEARRKRESREAAAKEEQAAQGGFTARDEAWFKAGKEADVQALAATRAELGRGGAPIPRVVVESPGDIEANISQAAAMGHRGDLDPRDFSLADYGYLMKERVRLDAELEHAGWWQARKLRRELRQVMKGGYGGASGSQGLEDYEKQIRDVQMNDGALRRDAAEREAEPKKPSFWERLRFGRGR